MKQPALEPELIGWVLPGGRILGGLSKRSHADQWSHLIANGKLPGFLGVTYDVHPRFRVNSKGHIRGHPILIELFGFESKLLESFDTKITQVHHDSFYDVVEPRVLELCLSSLGYVPDKRQSVQITLDLPQNVNASEYVRKLLEPLIMFNMSKNDVLSVLKSASIDGKSVW
jgi:hypothetical protein